MFVHKLRQTGDTIVEVLIAIAVIGSVLGITYATMNRNLLTTRDSQERTEASKLAQGQIEAFKGLADTGTTLPSLTGFCINVAAVVNLGGTAPTTDLTSDNFDATNYPVTPVGSNGQTGCVSGFYRIAIKRDSTDTKLWRFYVRWEKVSGSGRNEVVMVYRR